MHACATSQIFLQQLDYTLWCSLRKVAHCMHGWGHGQSPLKSSTVYIRIVMVYMHRYVVIL